MKMIMFLVLVLTMMVVAEEQTKPTAYMTSDPSYVTYYSVPVKEPSKFVIVYLEWKTYCAKFKYGWTLKEGQWVKVTFEKEQTPKVITLPIHIPPIRNSGGSLIIDNRTISGKPYKR